MEQTPAPEAAVSPRPDGLTRVMLSVLGGTLAIIGALITWATVGPRSEAEQLDPSSVRGPDLPEGWIALIIAVAIVLAAASVLVVGSPRLRGRLAVGMLAASIVIAGIGSKPPAWIGPRQGSLRPRDSPSSRFVDDWTSSSGARST